MPPVTVARQAVEAAFSKWKSGAKYGTIASSEYKMTFFDARWEAGKKLESYTITEEITGPPRQFKVRLTIVGQPEETTTYGVLGTDPLLVSRDADYARATGQEK